MLAVCGCSRLAGEAMLQRRAVFASKYSGRIAAACLLLSASVPAMVAGESGWRSVRMATIRTVSVDSHSTFVTVEMEPDPPPPQHGDDRGPPSERTSGFGSRLALIGGDRPLGVFDYVRKEGAGAVFAGRRLDGAVTPANCGGFVIDSGWAVELFGNWPEGCEFYARINRLSPGRRTLWLDLPDAGAWAEGTHWWLRLNGQPAAQLETLLVARPVGFCRVTPLAADIPLHEDDWVSLWPAPADRRVGTIRSAVANFTRTRDGESIWIAWPPGGGVSDGAHIEFRRGGRVIALGLVSRHDERFGYVRRLADLPNSPDVEAERSELRVGDEALVRGPSAIASGRFEARVFAQSDAGWMINAGEPEKMKRDAVGTVYREGAALGPARIVRLQPEYSLIRPVDASTRFALGDVFSQSVPIDRRPVRVGSVTAVVDRLLVRIAREAGARLEAERPLALAKGAQRIGVVAILDTTFDGAIGYVLPESLAGEVPEGATVLQDTD